MTAIQDRTEFLSADVVKLTGCSYRQLDFWCRSDLVQFRQHIRGLSSEHTATGSGTTRVFDRGELDVITTVTALIEAGFRLDKAFEYGRQMVESGQPVVLAGGLIRIGVWS